MLNHICCSRQRTALTNCIHYMQGEKEYGQANRNIVERLFSILRLFKLWIRATLLELHRSTFEIL